MTVQRCGTVAGTVVVAVSLGLAAATGVVAQGPGGGMGPGRASEFAGRGGQVVTGQPFSAQSTSSSVERLADGTTISHSTTITEARDALGRTLLTVTGSGDAAFSRTTLFDPVAHTVTSWDTRSELAVSMTLQEPRGAGWAGGARPAGDHPRGPGGRFHAQVTRQALAPKTIAGVYATGTLTTMTLPAGAEGNDKPLVSTREVWTSPDLKIVLLEISDNPRDGTHRMEVTSLTQAAPDATLFQVPAGYTLKEQTRHRGM